MNVERIPPQPGQESVWDYPRPPKVDPSPKHVRVILNGITLVDSRRTIRILETSHPPVFYLPPEDVKLDHFTPIKRQTICEYKGITSYYDIQVGDKRIRAGAWYYKQPVLGYEAIKNYIALYPSKMDACYVDEELVRAQEGDFYGGWITSEIVGPFKGGSGTWNW